MQYVPAASHTFTVLSALAVASMAPEGSTAMPITGALCPCREMQQSLGRWAAWARLCKPLAAAALGDPICPAQPACGCMQQEDAQHCCAAAQASDLPGDVQSLPSWQLKQHCALSIHSAYKALTHSCLHCQHLLLPRHQLIATSRLAIQCRNLRNVYDRHAHHTAAWGHGVQGLGASPVSLLAKPQHGELSVAVRHDVSPREA